MKAFLDTSVLVPVFLGDHVHHEASMKLFVSLNKAKGCCGAHSLAENLFHAHKDAGKTTDQR